VLLNLNLGLINWHLRVVGGCPSQKTTKSVSCCVSILVIGFTFTADGASATVFVCASLAVTVYFQSDYTFPVHTYEISKSLHRLRSLVTDHCILYNSLIVDNCKT
jgi:hypothetical protein